MPALTRTCNRRTDPKDIALAMHTWLTARHGLRTQAGLCEVWSRLRHVRLGKLNPDRCVPVVDDSVSEPYAFLNCPQKKIAQGRPVICAKASSPDAELVELLGTYEFDCIWICCLEHRALDPKEIYSLVQSCRLSGKDAVVRVRPKNYTETLWLLESGVRGIMLPRVQGVEEVRAIVADMKFPPLGRRGFDGLHADAGFGRTPAAEYLARANDETFLMVQIEDVAVLPHIDAIAALPGVDVLFVGPSDLSLALGQHGNMENPRLQKVIHDVGAACRRHGKVAGIPASVSEIPRYHAAGYGFFNVLTTQRCVLEGVRRASSELKALSLLNAARDVSPTSAAVLTPAGS